MTPSSKTLLYCVVASLVGILFVCGCATTEESDMPWGAPASWENGSLIPMFNDD